MRTVVEGRLAIPSAAESTPSMRCSDKGTHLTPLPLAPRFAQVVERSPRHWGAGFMATREQLESGEGAIAGEGPTSYGEQFWNYYRRSYPELIARHHPGW